MSSDWDEIKRLAADFQKAQITSTLQKLSERNCVEVVSLLLEKNLIDILFTSDGKEYITPDHLEKEILDEVYVSGGRVNLVEISKSLNVDFNKIESLATKIANENENIHLMLGQLFEEDYFKLIAEEINEKLAQKGEIHVSELTVQYDLPSEFLQTLMENHLGKVIQARQDASDLRTFFTQSYVQRCKSKLKGILTAVTKPTLMSSIQQQVGVPEKIIHSLIDQISPAGNVTAKLLNAHYVPHIYAKMQMDWVQSFYKQNGFLEYDAISKLGISDAKQFIKKNFPNEEMLYLKKCAVGPEIIDLTLITALNECNATTSYVDLSTILPTNMSAEDIEELFHTIISLRNIPNNFVYLDNVVFSKQFLENLLKPCNDLALEKAKAAIQSGLYQQFLAEKQVASSNKHEKQETISNSKPDKQEERRKKKTSSKASSGAGSQGRETKTKSTKNVKRMGGNKSGNADSDTETSSRPIKSLELVKPEEMEKIIGKVLEDENIEHLSEALTAIYHGEINKAAVQEAQNLFELTQQDKRRQTYASFEDKINTLLLEIRLYEKGLKAFPADVQSQLHKFLMKTLGNDICTELIIYMANEINLELKNPKNLNIDQRNKIIQEFEPEYRTKLVEVNNALNKTFDEFVLGTEEFLKECGIVLRKIDKKKDRLLISQHKEKLFQQLNETDDYAIALHLTSLIIFITITGSILHASGRFVSQILAFIRPNMSSEQNDLVMRFHDLVLQILHLDTSSDEYKIASEKLNLMLTDIKTLAKSYSKSGPTKAD